MSLSKALWSILFLLLCCQSTPPLASCSLFASFVSSTVLSAVVEAFGVQLHGAGSPNAVTIFASWSADYIYTRDDVGYVDLAHLLTEPLVVTYPGTQHTASRTRTPA